MRDYIDRYIYAVGEKLPKGQKDDIKEELRSLILDALDEKINTKKENSNTNYEASKEDVFEILKEFGSPAEVARMYFKNPKYLIGPEWFDLYKLVLIIGFSGMAIGVFISTISLSFNEYNDIVIIFIKLFTNLLSGIISTVGSVTIVFVLIQQFNGNESLDKSLNKDWSPKDLPKIPVAYNKVKKVETIFGICFTFLILIIFNIYPEKIAVFGFKDSVAYSISIFNINELKGYILFFNILWVVGIIIHLINLKKREWNIRTRIVTIIISFFSLVILIIAIKDNNIINPNLPEFPVIKDFIKNHTLKNIFDKVGIMIIIVAAIGTLLDISKHVYYIAKDKAS